MHIYIRGSPSGCVRREIPGVTQVDENGHKGNTVVVTAYTCWSKHGIYISGGIKKAIQHANNCLVNNPTKCLRSSVTSEARNEELVVIV